jgi:serine/threonine protein kinase
LEGEQLNELLKDSKSFSETEIKQILRNLLKGLSHLKKHNIIHRDLKPENIIFKNKNSNELAICDFGLATFADEPKYLFVRCGTPGFVAPEIINIRDMSTKS